MAAVVPRHHPPIFGQVADDVGEVDPSAREAVDEHERDGPAGTAARTPVVDRDLQTVDGHVPIRRFHAGHHGPGGRLGVGSHRALEDAERRLQRRLGDDRPHPAGLPLLTDL